jgi:tetratricopeptide (TPR) repeat protein
MMTSKLAVAAMTRLAIGAAILATLLAGCAQQPTSHYVPIDAVLGTMKARDARRVLASLKTIPISDCYGCNYWYASRMRFVGGDIELQPADGKPPIVTPFRSVPKIDAGLLRGAVAIHIGNDKWIWKDEEPGKRLAEALLVLRREHEGYENPNVEKQFQQAARAFRESGRESVFPEEARRFRVQAEAAVRAKDFEAAADAYDEALQVAPWWPEGHFNRALVLGETGAYQRAIVEMKRYLQLVPEAANARAAQDKIYEWEGKLTK